MIMEVAKAVGDNKVDTWIANLHFDEFRAEVTNKRMEKLMMAVRPEILVQQSTHGEEDNSAEADGDLSLLTNLLRSGVTEQFPCGFLRKTFQTTRTDSSR
jgi:hypothetical protein